MDHELPIPKIVLAFLLLVFTGWRSWNKSKGIDSSLNLPPGPWKLPFIGNIHQLLGSLPHHGIRDLVNKYGPVMQLQIGEVSTVIISSPEAAKEVLKTHELNFTERPVFLVGEIMFYNSKSLGFSPYGDYWRHMRKVSILEIFSAKRVKSFRTIREEEVSNIIRTIYSKAGSPINLSQMLRDLSIDITARASIGKKCENLEVLHPIIEDVLEAAGGMNIVDVFPSSKLIYMISKVRSRLENAHKDADKILEKIINERKVSKEVTKIDHENQVEDLLDVLLNLQNHGNQEFPLSTDSIKAIILELFTGGSDTSSTLADWTMSELLKNPRVMRKAQEEARQVFRDSEHVDETRLHNLKYLKLVIKETLRLHPPLPFIPRECIKTCEINGYAIQAKTKVLVNAWAIGRDSAYWTTAEKFYPERFQDSSIDYKGADFELIPFGAGKRICPGMLFGIANVELPLAQLLYHFDWKLPNGASLEDLDMKEAFGATVTRKNCLNLIPIPYGRSPFPVE